MKCWSVWGASKGAKNQIVKEWPAKCVSPQCPVRQNILSKQAYPFAWAWFVFAGFAPSDLYVSGKTFKGIRFQFMAEVKVVENTDYWWATAKRRTLEHTYIVVCR